MTDVENLSQFGRCWIRRKLSASTLAGLDRLYPRNHCAGERVKALDILNRGELREVLDHVLPGAFAVRAVAFDKSADRNWAVPWHQDRVIAVRRKIEMPGFRNWTSKSGIWHCEPPADVLRNMIFTRIFLDDVDASNGGMELALRSHGAGRITSGDAERIGAECVRETETAQRGDILVMSMYMLHRSGPASVQGTRRVVRADFANAPLPTPLEWASSA